MLKKLMLLLSCIGLLALVACGEENENETEDEPSLETELETELDPERMTGDLIEFEFSIVMISNDELTELEYNSEIDEIDYGVARDVFVTEGLNLLFNFNLPITDFTLIEIEFLEDGLAVKTGVLYEVGALAPDRPLVLTHYHGQGSMPASGFYFTGPDGEENWYVFHQSPMDGEIHWWYFDWSHDYGVFMPSEYEPEPEPEETDTSVAEVPPIPPVDTSQLIVGTWQMSGTDGIGETYGEPVYMNWHFFEDGTFTEVFMTRIENGSWSISNDELTIIRYIDSPSAIIDATRETLSYSIESDTLSIRRLRVDELIRDGDGEWSFQTGPDPSPYYLIKTRVQ